MVNMTVSYFILGAYLQLGNLRYLFLILTLLLYLFILVLNWFLIVLICLNRSLHEPMFLFLCSLFVNGLYGSTALFPFVTVQLLKDVHTVLAPFCFLQIFCLYSYAHVEFCNLAVMSYDRYLAICFPLQYNSRMTLHKACVLIIVVWLYSFLKFLITLALNLRLTLCGNIIDSIYCHNYLVAKLACYGNKVNNIYGLFGTVVTVVVPLIPILFSYIKILRICFAGSSKTRQKALSTCAPHLVSLLNFSFGCCFEILQSRFDMSSQPGLLRVVLSLYFLIIQPLLNPLMYGMQMSQIRGAIRRLFGSRRSTEARHNSKTFT